MVRHSGNRFPQRVSLQRHLRQEELCLIVQNAAVLFALKILVASPAVTRPVEMCILGQLQAGTAIAGHRESAFACPSPPIGRCVQKCMFRDDDRHAGITLCFKPARANPGWPMRVISQIGVIRQHDLLAAVVNFSETAQAVPSPPRRVKIPAFRNDNLDAGRPAGLDKTMQALPPGSISPVCRVSVLRHRHGDAGIAVGPVRAVALPAVAITFPVCVLRHRRGGCLGKCRFWKRSQQAKSDYEAQQYGLRESPFSIHPGNGMEEFVRKKGLRRHLFRAPRDMLALGHGPVSRSPAL